MAYKALGFVVWQGARWYLRRRYGKLVPSRRLLSGLFVGAAVVALAAGQARARRS